MKRVIGLLLKFGVTLGIFVGIFLEFGGGYRAVSTASLYAPGAFEASNPAYPGIVGRVRARLRGTALPPARVPVALADVCWVATERPVFAHLDDGSMRPFQPLRHCGGERGLAAVFVRSADGTYVPTPLASAPAQVYFRIQGFQLVPAEALELWAEIRNLKASVFIPWFLAAIAIKLLGIFANVVRWLILLRGQGVDLKLGYP